MALMFVVLSRCFLLLLLARDAESTTTTFTEDEENQVAMVTSHGAVIAEHDEELEGNIKQEYSEEDLEMMRADLAGEIDPDTGEILLERRDAGRRKRFLSKKASQRWPKAIVPFNFNMDTTSQFDRDEVIAAQTLWHKYTCVRFVPWVQEETKLEYGLPDEGHVKFTKGSSCSATQGNSHSRYGQWNSCCKRSTCTHEIGHTMGLWHEHQNPLRRDLLRVEWARVKETMIWTYRIVDIHSTLAWEYDAANSMHYGYPFYPLYEDLRSTVRMDSQYYMYKDVVLSHDCKGLHCSDFQQECYNDGFVTLLDGQCSCLCPPGLDPDTGCTTTIKQVTTSEVWPAGAYAFLAPVDGCPGTDVFAEGSWQHTGEGANKFSSEVNLAGNFTAESFRYEFCVKSADRDPVDAPVFETGRYCILSAGGECPSGFTSGFIQFDDSAEVAGSGSGQLPDGNFSADTRLDFCCRDDGFHNTPLSTLPNNQPLVLFPNARNKGYCQKVAGMRPTKEFLQFDSYPGLVNTGGEIPFGSKDNNIKIEYCYYEPVNHNCGGEIILSSTNPQAEITSPNFPEPYDTNMECTWLIKTENQDDRVLLNFDHFEITAKDDNCADSLEIRYNLNGQPGIRFCGDGLSKTIQSMNNTILLTLRSDRKQVVSDNGFRATASFHSPATEHCYDPETKGVHYRGTKDYTRSQRKCVPWAAATKCLSHPFKPSDFGKGLEENFCRNPDNTAQPWCYTDYTCGRDYCDVCNVERVYDRKSECKADVCDLSRAEIIAAGCAASCEVAPPSAPVRDQTCGAPETLSDAEIVETVKDSYAVGETITYKCKTGEEITMSTCLSDGQWSPIGYVCGACDPGWAYNRGSCYKVIEVEKRVNVFGAQDICAAHGALLATVKDDEEMDFVSELRPVETSMWIGMNDTEEENSFVWSDGTPVTNQTGKWAKGQPNNYRNQDCVYMTEKYKHNRWSDVYCDRHYMSFLACKYTLSERVTCADRLDCQAMLETSPELCSQHPDFALHECPLSCGACDSQSAPTCSIDPPTPYFNVTSPVGQDTISRGSSVTFSCAEGHLLISGQLTLACGLDGNLLGQTPDCKDPAHLIQESNDEELIARPKLGFTRYGYMGVGSALTIQRNGVVKQWKYYSPTPGWSVFQVWRPQPEVGKYSYVLVGQTQVLTQGQGEETFDIPDHDLIYVQKGDRLALWEGASPLSRGRVPYSNCASGEKNSEYGVIRAPANYRADFSTEKATTFSKSTYCRKFSYKAVIYPVNSVPDNVTVASNHASMFVRGSIGAAKKLYFGDSSNFIMPTSGEITEWQFYAKSTGDGALQVWRPIDKDKFEFIGQTMLKITKTGVMTIPLAEGERIAVQQGDRIAAWYGDSRIGINFDFCSASVFPEGGLMRTSTSLEAADLTVGDVVKIPLRTNKECFRASFRAIITPTPTM